MFDKAKFEQAQATVREMRQDPEYKRLQENLDKAAVKVVADLNAYNIPADVLDILARARKIVNEDIAENLALQDHDMIDDEEEPGRDD